MGDLFANPIAATLVSALAVITFTAAVRWFARKYDFVAKPKADRWHRRPTAMLGGAAIYLTVVSMYLSFAPKTFDSIIVLAGASFLFFVGLVDDLINIKPYQKLIGQLFGATFVVGMGLKLPITAYELIVIWLTVASIIGITNAINLLDDMDG